MTVKNRICLIYAQESELLLELFFKQITKPAYTARFRWNNGDVAFWDNRATAHLAPQDIDHIDVERVLLHLQLHKVQRLLLLAIFHHFGAFIAR